MSPGWNQKKNGNWQLISSLFHGKDTARWCEQEGSFGGQWTLDEPRSCIRRWSPWGDYERMKKHLVPIIPPWCTHPETSPSWKCSRRQTWTEESPLRRCCRRCKRPRFHQLCPAAGRKSSKTHRTSALSSAHLAHLQRDAVVFSRYESVDVIVPELLHHGRQLSVALDHAGAAAAALLVLRWWAGAGRVSEKEKTRLIRTSTWVPCDFSNNSGLRRQTAK